MSLKISFFTCSDSDHISVLTLLDLSAAFDTMDHDLLLICLRDVFGILDTALAFFWSYLSRRKQIVSVLGRESEPSSLLYSVPQGSVVSPILFILYTQPPSDLNITLFYITCLLMTLSCTTQLLVPAFMLFSANMQNCVSDVKKWTIHSKR